MGLTRTFMAASAALCCLLTGIEVFDRLSGNLILTKDPIQNTQSLAAEGRWAEVKMITDFLADRPDLADPQQITGLAGQAETELNSFWKHTLRFTDGAVTGEPTDLTSMLGSLSLDLFLIGDIRDLAIQGWKQVNYGSGDTLIITLSAIGLSTTLVPHLDWVPALMKTLKRTGALTKSFTKSLTRASREALKSRKYGKLSAIASDMGKAAKHLGPGPLRGAMSAVDSADDLTKVAKAAKLDAKGTYALTQLVGKSGVKRINKDGKNIGVLVTSLKVGSRATKTISKFFKVLPTTWLLLVLSAAIVVLVATLLPRRRVKNRGVQHMSMQSSEAQLSTRGMDNQ